MAHKIGKSFSTKLSLLVFCTFYRIFPRKRTVHIRVACILMCLDFFLVTPYTCHRMLCCTQKRGKVLWKKNRQKFIHHAVRHGFKWTFAEFLTIRHDFASLRAFSFLFLALIIYESVWVQADKCYCFRVWTWKQLWLQYARRSLVSSFVFSTSYWQVNQTTNLFSPRSSACILVIGHCTVV